MRNIFGNEHARRLLADGIRPYRETYFDYVRAGSYEIVNRFWLAGFVNIKDSRGSTDLHIACEKGHAAIAEGIIRHGGDPRLLDKDGLTPLMTAAIEGRVKVAEVLMAHDCAISSKSTSHGCSALFLAAAHGSLGVVDLLLKEGAHVDAFDQENKTPLMAAIAQGKWDVADRLLKAGATVTRVDGDGASVMDYASAFRAPEEIIESISNLGGQQSSPNLRSTGHGFSRFGHVRVRWERVAPEAMN